MELFSYAGDWDLPSIDPFCLSIETFLYLARVSGFSIRDTNDPFQFPGGRLPVLRDGPELFYDSRAIVEHCKRNGYNLDQNLTEAQRAHSQALISLLENNLYDVMMYFWWAVPENRKYVISLYAKMLPFSAKPSLLYGGGMLEWVEKRLHEYSAKGSGAKRLPISNEAVDTFSSSSSTLNLLHSVHGNPDVAILPASEEAILNVARSGYQALEALLGEQDYVFGGSVPSTVDCFAYGHLALHLYATLPRPTLAQLLQKEFPKLHEYIGRFRRTHFSRDMPFSQSIWIHKQDWEARLLVKPNWNDLFREYSPLRWFSNIRKGKGIQEEEQNEHSHASDPEKELERAILKNRIWYIASGIGAFVAFVWWRGIVEFDFSDEQEEEMEEEQEDGNRALSIMKDDDDEKE